MENKNTLIAIVLMAVVWAGFTFFFKPQQADVAPDVTQVQKSAAAKAEKVVLPVEGEKISAPPADIQTSVVEKSVDVENDFFQLQLSTSGARVKQLALKQYRVAADPDSDPVILHPGGTLASATLKSTGSDGLPVPANAPFQLVSGNTPVRLKAGESAELVFRYTDDANGLQVDKIYRFNGDSYQFDLQYQVKNISDQNRSGVLQLTLVQPWDEELHASRYDFIGPVTLTAKDLETDKVKKLEEQIKTYRQPVWSGFETKYFLSAAAPLNGSADKVSISKDGEMVQNSFSSSYLNLAPQAVGAMEFNFYFGPRDFEILEQAGHQFGKAIDLGFFAPIASPLRYVLNFFYGFVGNYGVAIILLTVIIKLIFWPLTQKSYTSMKEMQKIQPEMTRLREKYKNNKEKLNKEIMAMYKEKRVNPLGGCLPMLIQIPVFFALYRVLMVDIALRHAPFVFWLQDLSAKDPYYITPIIMGGTMFIQQKMTPTTMDPKQAKMFMMMPVVFTFLFLNFPSGLVIYWLTNNLLTIGQQYMIHRKPA